MSLRMNEQRIIDHIKIQELSKKKEDEFEDKIIKINKSIKGLREGFDKKLDLIIKAISNIQQTTIIQTAVGEKSKKEIVDTEPITSPMFIPDIDTSDLKMNAKEDNKKTKDIDLGSSLDALDNLNNI